MAKKIVLVSWCIKPATICSTQFILATISAIPLAGHLRILGCEQYLIIRSSFFRMRNGDDVFVREGKRCKYRCLWMSLTSLGDGRECLAHRGTFFLFFALSSCQYSFSGL